MAIIKNFGFMWARDKVEWGSKGQGGKGKLRGFKVDQRQHLVDFRRQMGIYVLYDKFETPIQIGQSQVLFKRLKDHRRDHLRNRWSSFSWFGFYKAAAGGESLIVTRETKDSKRTVTLGDALNEVEAVLIQVLEPRLNRRGSNWNDTEEYLQYIESSPDDDGDDTDLEDQ